LIEKAWASGLDGPKGGAILNGKLYVTDITRLVGLDLATGKAVETHDIPGARFLNDLAVAPDGQLLAADSQTARIYAKSGKGEVVVWAEGPELRAVNGLLPEKDRLVVSTMAGKLLAIDYATRAVTVLADGLGDADGVVRLDDGSYLVSEWPGLLHRVAPAERTETLIDSREAGTYINDILRVGDLLIAPNWKPGSLTAYRIR
jgi:outer membrane protein assembly factor BamB